MSQVTTSRTATVFTDPPSAKPPLWVMPIRAAWPLVMSLVVAIVIFHFVVPRINDYQQVRISNCGIYIILAVSLTVVNGFTGQFSIGHSGFMAVGGYAAASLMFYGTYHCYGNTDFHGGLFSFSGLHTKGPGSFITGGDWLFLGSLLFGAVVAAGIGWVVGLPSLRLRGDYLAIVTLGFCEIVRVIHPKLAGSTDTKTQRSRRCRPGADVPGRSIHFQGVASRWRCAGIKRNPNLCDGFLDHAGGAGHLGADHPAEIFRVRPGDAFDS